MTTAATIPSRAIFERSDFPSLIDALRNAGWQVIGPTARDGAIVYDELKTAGDLPAGWTDEQEGGTYRLKRRDDDALFGYAVRPHSWKKFLHPLHLRLWRAERDAGGFQVVAESEEALRIIEAYEMPDKAAVDVQPRAATGYGCTEAPRGALYHRYRTDGQGVILDARIIPPTSQNQKTIEDDLRQSVQKFIDLPKAELTSRCEQAIRNYDPCISCATHFLRLEMERE